MGILVGHRKSDSFQVGLNLSVTQIALIKNVQLPFWNLYWIANTICKTIVNSRHVYVPKLHHELPGVQGVKSECVDGWEGIHRCPVKYCEIKDFYKLHIENNSTWFWSVRTGFLK